MGKKDLPKEPYWDGPLAHPFYSKVVKRVLDLLLALILLVPGLLLMLPLAVWVKGTITSPSGSASSGPWWWTPIKPAAALPRTTTG